MLWVSTSSQYHYDHEERIVVSCCRVCSVLKGFVYDIVICCTAEGLTKFGSYTKESRLLRSTVLYRKPLYWNLSVIHSVLALTVQKRQSYKGCKEIISYDYDVSS